jgi:cytochrome c biogenesis protein CcmG/thiol:disulfide interchange protein DsbE
MTQSNRRQWTIVAAVVAVLGALVALGWSARGRFLPVEVGSSAPEVRATDMRGAPARLSSLRGQVVLLNIWATWCGPCQQEMPSMERLYRTLRPEGLHIVAVSIDATAGKVDEDGRMGGDVAGFAREYGLSFDIWQDPAGTVRRDYRTTGVPESFLLDRGGRIVKKVIGATEWDDPATVDLIRRLLKE